MAALELQFTDPLPLGLWYADPLDPRAAGEVLDQVHRQRQAAHQRGVACANCACYELIARFWLGRPVTATYDTLRASAPTARERALADLVMGQLRMSRRLRGAMELLQRGFFAAAPYLQALSLIHI